MGAIAIRLHCTEFEHLHMERELSDIDLMSHKAHEASVKNFLVESGYEPMGGGLSIIADRQIYFGKYHVDVFFDKLEMCHVINFVGRLELDFPTITLADLLLEKMQIVKINEKDLKDTALLLRAHDLGEEDNKETINSSYISRLLSKDWGFYYTVTTNLRKVRSFSSTYFSSPEDEAIVDKRCTSLLDRIEIEPKSMSWKIRAKIGTKKQWYQDVGEVLR